MQKISQAMIGKKIKAERIKRGLSQSGLGGLLYMHESRVCRMEGGEALNLEKLELVANALDIDVRELFVAGVIDY